MPKTAKLEPLTVSELRLCQARLTEKADRLRARLAAMVSTSPSCMALAREIRGVQKRADDYGQVLGALEAAGLL